MHISNINYTFEIVFFLPCSPNYRMKQFTTEIDLQTTNGTIEELYIELSHHEWKKRNEMDNDIQSLYNKAFKSMI